MAGLVTCTQFNASQAAQDAAFAASQAAQNTVIAGKQGQLRSCAGTYLPANAQVPTCAELDAAIAAIPAATPQAQLTAIQIANLLAGSAVAQNTLATALTDDLAPAFLSPSEVTAGANITITPTMGGGIQISAAGGGGGGGPSGPPTGPAGGGLTGTYPNPNLSASAVLGALSGATAGAPAMYGTSSYLGADGMTHLLPALPAGSASPVFNEALFNGDGSSTTPFTIDLTALCAALQTNGCNLGGAASSTPVPVIAEAKYECVNSSGAITIGPQSYNVTVVSISGSLVLEEWSTTSNSWIFVQNLNANAKNFSLPVTFGKIYRVVSSTGLISGIFAPPEVPAACTDTGTGGGVGE